MRFGLLLVENYLAYARVTQDHYLEQHPSDDEKSYADRARLPPIICYYHDAAIRVRAPHPPPVPRKTDGSDFCLGPTFGCQTRLAAAISAEAPLASRTELC